jgi:hypothetical protein
MLPVCKIRDPKTPEPTISAGSGSCHRAGTSFGQRVNEFSAARIETGKQLGSEVHNKEPTNKDMPKRSAGVPFAIRRTADYGFAALA